MANTTPTATGICISLCYHGGMDAQMEDRLSNANSLREQERFDESAAEYTRCLIDLIDTNDWTGLIHCLGGQSLIYKILTKRHDSPIYNSLVLAFAKEAYEIAEQHKDLLDSISISTAYRVYGDALLHVGDLEGALPQFQSALDISTASYSEKGMIKNHMGLIKYILGEKQEGIDTIKEALGDIRSGDLNSYAVRVWETGALNNLSKIYSQEGDTTLALEIANEALTIAKVHKLAIREKETQKIIDQISSGMTQFSLV